MFLLLQQSPPKPQHPPLSCSSSRLHPLLVHRKTASSNVIATLVSSLSIKWKPSPTRLLTRPLLHFDSKKSQSLYTSTLLPGNRISHLFSQVGSRSYAASSSFFSYSKVPAILALSCTPLHGNDTPHLKTAALSHFLQGPSPQTPLFEGFSPPVRIPGTASPSSASLPFEQKTAVGPYSSSLRQANHYSFPSCHSHNPSSFLYDTITPSRREL